MGLGLVGEFIRSPQLYAKSLFCTALLQAQGKQPAPLPGSSQFGGRGEWETEDTV